MSRAERRSSPRVDARIAVAFKNGEEFTRCYTENISKGGILLETTELPDPNALVEVVLTLPPENSSTSERRLSLKGKVVRRITVSVDSKQVHKIGLQFVDVPPDTQHEIDRVYEKLSRA